MQEAYVNINGVPTHIITWGRWIEESMHDVDEVAICITGNPGLPGFYTEYAGALYSKLGSKIPIWIIGHAGHDDPPQASIRTVPQLKGNESLFDLDGQIKHKIEFIEKYVASNTKIHLIGHSIGAWMILQLLQNESIRSKVIKCYMLFPTIENMVETRNGWIFTKIVMPMYAIFCFALALFYRLPELIRIFLIQLYFWIFAIPNHLIGTGLKYAKPSVMQKVIFLAEDEMVRVRDLQRNVVRDNLHLLKLFYGTTDGWVPVKYYQRLIEQFPKVDAELDTRRIDHAFVLRFSNPMAEIVGEMIQKNTTL